MSEDKPYRYGIIGNDTSYLQAAIAHRSFGKNDVEMIVCSSAPVEPSTSIIPITNTYSWLSDSEKLPIKIKPSTRNTNRTPPKPKRKKKAKNGR